ncbi:atlastin-2-like isoform X1 [Branchiostoma floridae]|uniref:Atlastin-2-like isoform X1 n=3 Tax=Branchiostoma floridae TaxID=7739 RepID=A0A9J7LS35_BRAFL|nr:atlastin-2-like isoform X1 [Branchiostoma floridae]
MEELSNRKQMDPAEENMSAGDTIGLNGRPIPVVLVNSDDHTFELDEDALRSVLLKEHIQDKKVVVVSVAGAFRKGKSFLLNFFLRYLKSKCWCSSGSTVGKDEWLGQEDQQLEGFSWRGGSERHTTGILIWSDPFIVTLPNGEEVAIVLLDTQGAFDSQSTVKDCATVFALSTMTSSVQVYNLTQNIQEDDLQHLQLFTEYGRLALEDTNSTPFQVLEFLVRDWSYPYEAEYGSEGGRNILERRLEIADKQHEELQNVRRHIKKCFEKTGCFLMPHPGMKVATNPVFDGRLQDIESDFKEQLKVLVPQLLEPTHLVVKKINGADVTARELVEYFKAYVNVFKSDELPEPKSMLQATAEANNLAAVATAKALYQAEMEKICGGNQPYLNPDELEAHHQRFKENCLEIFHEKKKMGGEEYSSCFAEQLDKEVEEAFEHFSEQNDSKNIFRAAQTPATLFAVMVVTYVLSGFFALLGMYTVANILTAVLWASLVSLCTWSYIRYSGQYREVGTYIDLGAEVIWEKVVSQAYMKVVQKGVEHSMANNRKKKN